jgi:alginate O-acetyltransferase complex protein AlgI
MLFPTPEFLIIFLPIALVGFHLCGRFGRTAAMGWLSFISVVFYATWRIDYVPLLLGSVLFNYACATGITKSANRPRLQRAIMIGGIVANLGVLVFFKYLFPSLSALVSLGLVRHSWSGFLLPLGISFFTFTQIGYLIDLRGEPLNHTAS